MRKKVMNPALLQKGWMNRATLARLFRGFSNEKRIRIIRALLSGWVKINDIADYTDLPYKTVERHLKILGSASIVKQTRKGKFFDFELNTDSKNYLLQPLTKALEIIKDYI